MLKPEQFHIGRLYIDITYEGLLLGVPNPEMNKESIDGLLTLTKTLFSHREVTFIDPVIEKPSPDMPWHQRLPNYRIIGTISSREGIEDYGNYRMFSFTGFINSTENLKESIADLLKDVNWFTDSELVDIDKW